MSYNYEEQLINLLENNKINSLPDAQLIQTNERVALAVWKNFVENYEDLVEGGTYFSSWYESGKFGVSLQPYANNVDFWKTAFTDHDEFSPLEPLKNADFKKDFPYIVNHFVNNIEFLKDIILTEGNYSANIIIDIINESVLSSNDKNNLIKDLIIKYPHSVNDYIIKGFEDDNEFVKRILTKTPYYYTKLSDTNKLNDEFISLALVDKNLYKELPAEKKEQFFPVWAETRAPFVTLKEVGELTLEQQKEILVNRADLLESFYTQAPTKYIDTVVKSIEKDFSKNFYAFNNLQLIKIFQDSDNLDKIRPQLENFIENYKGVQQINKKENRVISVIALDTDLQNKLLNNVYYKFNDMSGNTVLELEDFNKIVETVNNDMINKTITPEKAVGFLNRVKNKLSTEDTLSLGLNNNHVAHLLNQPTPQKFKR